MALATTWVYQPTNNSALDEILHWSIVDNDEWSRFRWPTNNLIFFRCWSLITRVINCLLAGCRHG